MKSLLLFAIVSSTLNAQALERLPLPSAGTGPTKATAVPSLQAVLRDPRYETCRRDLVEFVANLSATDLKTIQKQSEVFEASKLSVILKEKTKGALAKSIEVDDMMKSVSILIPHGKMKCQISIYPKLEMDQLKGNIDPTSPDIKIRNGSFGDFEVDATLVGASASLEDGSKVRFDGSKAMTIFKRFRVEDMETQIELLEEFRKSESAVGSATRPADSPSSDRKKPGSR